MKKTTGLSLIEILISLILMSVLLLGIDAMQITSIQQAKSNYYFAIAQQQIKVMHERLNLAHSDEFISSWNKQNQQALPGGKGVVTNGIAVFWGNRNEENCKSNQTGSEGCLHLRL